MPAACPLTAPQTLSERVSHVGERLCLHVGVPDDVVCLAHEFVERVAADLDEARIGVGDSSLEIGTDTSAAPCGSR